MALEQSKLQKQKLELEQDRTKLYHDRQTLITLEQNLKVQSLQVNRTSQIAQEVHTEGEQSLAIAHRIQQNLNTKMVEIQRREKTQVLDYWWYNSVHSNLYCPVSNTD